MNELQLPVSMGEALDKLTILEIKMKNITDNRKIHVINEYDILNIKLDKYKKKFSYYYKILYLINEHIWNILDKFNATSKEEEKCRMCIEIIKENENRFRIKQKINNISDSSLKEQKGYKQKHAFVLTHLGLGDHILCIGAVRYLSTCYDTVLLVCKQHNKQNMELFYMDDDNIELYLVENDSDISPRYGCKYETFAKITQDMDLYIAGSHCLNKHPNPYTDLPLNFYRDMIVDESCFETYFHINTPHESSILYNKLKDIPEYIFLHNSASNGIIFSIDYVETQLNINRHDVLIVNPNYNIYNQNDKLFGIANEFVNFPLAYYIETINNASKIIITDSSFFALAMMLPIKTSKCYLKKRDNNSYTYATHRFIEL